MFQRFRARFRRNTAICVCILAAALLLKYKWPEAGRQVGKWVSGAESGIAQAVSAVVDRLSSGDTLTDAVEVFREAIQDSGMS